MTNFLELLDRVHQEYVILPEEQFHELCNKVLFFFFNSFSLLSLFFPSSTFSRITCFYHTLAIIFHFLFLSFLSFHSFISFVIL